VQFSRSIGSTIGISVLGAIVANVFATSFATAQTPELKRGLAAAAAAAAHKQAIQIDPQVLVSPQSQQAILAVFKAALGPQAGKALFDQFLTTVSGSLLDGLRASFIAMLVMAVAALVATAFLKEIPLRTTIASPEKDGATSAEASAMPLVME
jgi:hypothetical protein